MKQLDILRDKFTEFTLAVKNLLERIPETATIVDDTIKLAGLTRTQVLTEARSEVEKHTLDRNNPHKVTLASLGGATTTYVDNLLSSTVSLAELPVSQFGDTTDSPLGVTFSGWSLRFTQGIQAYIQGVLGLLPIENIDLTSIDPSPGNKIFYVYLGLEEGIPGYRVLLDKLPETDSTMYIGSVFTGPSGIVSNSIDRVTRVGTYRLSNVAKGSAIPVTTGDINESEVLDLSWTSDPTASRYLAYDRLIPPQPFIAVTDDGRGRVVYDGGFPKFYNAKAPAADVTTFSDLSASFKYLYNSINWVADPIKLAQGKRKILILGDKSAGNYTIKGIGGDSFFTSMTRLLTVVGYDSDFKDISDYESKKIDVEIEDLEQYALVILFSTASTTTAPITEQCISNLAAFRHTGGGLIVITDHGPSLPTLDAAKGIYGTAFFTTGNKVITRFGAWFSGNYNRTSVNVGYLRDNYGDHPLYAGMLDTESIDAGGSESRIFIPE